MARQVADRRAAQKNVVEQHVEEEHDAGAGENLSRVFREGFFISLAR